jgi:hypothetical protein
MQNKTLGTMNKQQNSKPLRVLLHFSTTTKDIPINPNPKSLPMRKGSKRGNEVHSPGRWPKVVGCDGTNQILKGGIEVNSREVGRLEAAERAGQGWCDGRESALVVVRKLKHFGRKRMYTQAGKYLY